MGIGLGPIRGVGCRRREVAGKRLGKPCEQGDFRVFRVPVDLGVVGEASLTDIAATCQQAIRTVPATAFQGSAEHAHGVRRLAAVIRM